jgi:cob(I)alamin adenosyltransferase
MESGSPKIYTRTGDKGKTSLIGGARVSKSNPRLEAYGTLDETNSWLGVAMRAISEELAGEPSTEKHSVELLQFLTRTQSDLFDLGSHLACEDEKFRATLPKIQTDHVRELEMKMDEFSKQLKPLKNFVLPGGCRSAGFAHLARTSCRKAERLCVALSEATGNEHAVAPEVIEYLNRLSDFLFVMARHLNRLMKIEEPIWAPRK